MSKDNEKILCVRCGDTVFEFPLGENDTEWYCLDGRESVNGSERLKINADRDVYAVYTDKDGVKHYGTIGDRDDRAIADNSSCGTGDPYIFYEDPETEKYYV